MEFRIYVANLTEYNNGALVGKWIDLPCDDFSTELESIRVSVGDSFAIHDYELPFTVSEHESIEAINELVESILLIDDADIKALGEHFGDMSSFKDGIEAYNDGELIVHMDMSIEDVARNLINDLYNTDELGVLSSYIDYKAYGRDLTLDGNYTEYTSWVIEDNR